MDVKAGLSVSGADMGSFVIPAGLEDHFFLVVAELRRCGWQLDLPIGLLAALPQGDGGRCFPRKIPRLSSAVADL